ncbi:hypothetical protein [Texcoconibacillus texcoconensis]|uniref:Uncharacterized protein n=1 Tax=Texcoconibacillus texcoconensis TaxID=1095777 RepID=A0A840QSD9_9BACI|nr:hypothetical protein [Texcoconibacillus texcoconensis]MBB5174260.1 hypothetical protein [Texcoconibacillus texcoconensis]
MRALQDYSLLIGNTITNQQLRSFLRLESRMTAQRILQDVAIGYKGNYRDRVYQLPVFL